MRCIFTSKGEKERQGVQCDLYGLLFGPQHRYLPRALSGVREAIGKPDGDIAFDDVAGLDELVARGVDLRHERQ